MPVALAAGALGLGAASSLIGENQKKQAEKGKQGQINAIFQGLSPDVQALYEQAAATLSHGYDQGAQQLNSYGQTAKTNISVAGKQSESALSENAISKGLGSTSYLQSLHHGISQGTAKSLTSVDEAKANLMSQLLTQKGSSLASLYTSLAAQKANIGTNYASVVAGQPAISSAPSWQMLGGGFNALGQGILGGGGG